MTTRAALKRLRAEWARKLSASGFQDLERAGDPSGPLSNRGLLHPVESTGEAWRRLAERTESGLDWTIWAQGVLHYHPFANAQQREVWGLYANGGSERNIAAALAIPRDRVVSVLAAVRASVRKAETGSKGGKSRRWKNEKRQKLQRITSKIRQLSGQQLREALAVTTMVDSVRRS